MSEPTAETDATTDPEDAATEEEIHLDPLALAEQVGQARQRLREGHPGCFPDQEDSCQAVLDADADLEAVESVLRGVLADDDGEEE